MKRIIPILTLLVYQNVPAQNVGIGTTIPKARLHVADSSVIFNATGIAPVLQGDAPVNGAGRRMMWYVDKAAFRAGYASGTEWDKPNVGNYSFAAGYGVRASGDFSVALGLNNIAGGQSSIAIGTNAQSNPNFSIAIGAVVFSLNEGAVAIGFGNTAQGRYSLALGRNNIAKSLGGTVVGQYNDFTDNPNPNDTSSLDRIFQVGNGYYDENIDDDVRRNAVTVLRNGNTGIGTTTPANQLSVVGNSDITGKLGIGTNAPNYPLSFSNTLGDKISLYATSNNNYGFGIVGGLFQIHSDAPGADIAFGWGHSSFFNEVMRIKGSGNVGIGTSAPTNKLSVNGTANFSGSVGIGTSSPTNALSVIGNADFSGNVGIGMAPSTYRLHISSSPFSFRIDGPGGPGSNTVALSVGGYGTIQIDKPGTVGGRFIIKENGNVGIDISIPQNKLDVNGDVNIIGSLKLNGSTGNTMQLMTSNGSANPSWISPSNIIKTEYGGSASLELTNSTTTNLSGSTYTVTLSVPSRVILLYKSRIYKNCTIGECAAKFEFTVYLNGQYIKSYQLRASGLLTGNAAYWTDATNGPDFFDLPAGSHTFTFTGQCVWTPPFTIEEFRVYSMIIPQ